MSLPMEPDFDATLAFLKIPQKHHWDSATLRRELIGYRMLKRQRGMYWRQPESTWLQA